MITEQNILDGLNNDEFVYYYQPKISLITGKVIGAEALIRWIKPDGHIVLPQDFVPLAEQTGILSLITYKMFAKLARDLLIFSDIDSSLIISFNTSAQDFVEPDFRQMVLDTLSQLRIPPSACKSKLPKTPCCMPTPPLRKIYWLYAKMAWDWRWTITAPVTPPWKP